jgi:hypothetical protein
MYIMFKDKLQNCSLNQSEKIFTQWHKWNRSEYKCKYLHNDTSETCVYKCKYLHNDTSETEVNMSVNIYTMTQVKQKWI